MKYRSLLLVACMLVVPLLAMFSHKIPADVRAAMRRGLRDALGHCLGRPAEAGVPAVAPAIPAENVVRLDSSVDTPATRSSVDALAPVTKVAPATSGDAPSPELVAQLADRSRQARDQQARDQRSIETRLRDLGAMAFDCQPLPGAAGLYSSSCRVPVDASGQLQRVFQATGTDPLTASETLAQQVAAWRQRAVDRVPGTGPAATTAGQSPPTRFR